MDNQELTNLIAAYSILILFIFLATIVLIVLFLSTLSNALKQIKPIHREIEPGEVWLLLIPIFNLIWSYVVVIRLSDSVQKEFNSRNLGKETSYGVGLAYSILSSIQALSIFMPAVGFIFLMQYSIFLGWCWIAQLICGITYWVRVSNIKSILQNSNWQQPSFSNQSNANQSNANQNGFRLCTNCGVAASPNTNYCNSCGTPLSYNNSQPTSTGGYSGGYSGGHNNHQNSQNNGAYNQHTPPPLDSGYKSGELYK
jgi:hypothetical protein